jgi:two-component system, LytTR family, sensor kinase
MKKTFLQQFFAWAGGFLFLLIINFALGGILFFTMQGLNIPVKNVGKEIEANEFYYIFTGNIVESVVALICLQIFMQYHLQLRKKWWRYAVLLASVYVFCIVVQYLFFVRPFDVIKMLRDIVILHPMEIVFDSNILIATALLYNIYLREEKQQKKMAEQEFAFLEMRELRTKAELEALQAKINPHFLYNSLNSIASLIHESPDKAEQMVLLLAKFFRYSTNAKSQYFTRLTHELEMVETYLQVEKVRFDERLTYHIHFENEDLKDCLVPQFLIQPLVENAIKHGISKITGKGILEIEVSEKDKYLIISIFDNGLPFPENINSGYGLRSTQDKLRLLCGEDARLEISNRPRKGVVITLRKQNTTLLLETEKLAQAI